MTSAAFAPVRTRQAAPLALAAAGTMTLGAGLVVGGPPMAYAAVGFLVAAAVAAVESQRRFLTWQTGIAFLILVFWFIPIKKYALPVALPFDLEVYRLLVLLLGVLLVGAVASGRAALRAGGQGKPLALLATAAVVALLANIGRISELGLQTQAIKALSFFLSVLLVFVLVSSTMTRLREITLAFSALVVGGTTVALFAIWESRTGYNAFDDLDSVVPILERLREQNENVRAGRLRVRASAQHAIALGSALVMCMPIALYLARAASSRMRMVFWGACATILAIGALATISRTVVFMLLTMGFVAVKLRRRAVIRLLPLLLVLPFLVKVAAPGSLRTLYGALTPEGGLVAQQNARGGEQGSGRVADLGPGLRLWSERPWFGRGLGTGTTRGDRRVVSTVAADEPRIIFDDEYLRTLVYSGIVGLVATAWFIWGTVMKLGRTAARHAGENADLLAAGTASCAAFGTSMFFFDAFAFVQVTLVFFVIAALALRARTLAFGAS